MKLINLIQIRNTLNPNIKFKDIQAGYKVMKFLKSIEDDVTFYNKKLSEIAQECAEKDGNEIKTTENGDIVLAKDKISVWNKKIDDLANIEIDVKPPSFELKDFSECNFTLGELRILEPLFSE